MEELLVLAASSFVMMVTQVLKPYVPVNPLWVALGASLVCGLIFASLVTTGYWEAVARFGTVLFGGAVTVFNVFKQAGVIDRK